MLTFFDVAFSGCEQFNADLSLWNVSKVTTLQHSKSSEWQLSVQSEADFSAAAFCDVRQFNSDLSKWDVSNVNNMEYSKFDKVAVAETPSWLSNAVFHGYSSGSQFNADLSTWNVSRVTRLAWSKSDNNASLNLAECWLSDEVFSNANQFNADISKWDVSKIKSLGYSKSHTVRSETFSWMLTFLMKCLKKLISLMLTSANGMYLTSRVWAKVSNASFELTFVKYWLFDVAFEYASQFNADLGKWKVHKNQYLFYSKFNRV